MRSLFSLLFFLVAVALAGQYSDSSAVDSAAGVYSRAELRTLFLSLEQQPEIYALARQSKNHYAWSTVAHTAGALSSLVALVYLHGMLGKSDAFRVEPFLAIGAATACFTLGHWQLTKSKLRLQNAKALYRERISD